MRKVIFEIAVSIDGYIEGPDGALDWVTPVVGWVEKEFFDANKFLMSFDTIFYGRDAYEKCGIYRPLDPDQPEAARDFHSMVSVMRKYVFTRTERHVPGNGMVIHDNLESEVKRIREEEGKNIWFCGGANILKTFMDLDLVDEYVLAVQPVVLGAGKPLFRKLKNPLEVKLIKTQNLKSGVVILHYQPRSRMNQ